MHICQQRDRSDKLSQRDKRWKIDRYKKTTGADNRLIERKRMKGQEIIIITAFQELKRRKISG